MATSLNRSWLQLDARSCGACPVHFANVDLNPADASDLGYSALKEQIRTLVRDARGDESQAHFSAVVGINRSTLSRIESGHIAPSLKDAKAIAARREAPGLLELVTELREAEEERKAAPRRDLVVGELLERPGIVSVQALVVDDFPISTLLQASPSLSAAEVEVVVPTVDRETALFNGRGLLFGRFEHQIKRLIDLGTEDSSAPISVKLFESDDVLQSIVVVRSSSGVECAIWPTLPVSSPNRATGISVDGRHAPVVVPTDPMAIGKVTSHVEAVLERAAPIRKNAALGVLDDDESASVESPVLFTGFETYDAIPEDLSSETTEGVAVSLVLVHGLARREGQPLAHRVLLHRRDNESNDVRRWSLPSNGVDDLDVRGALGLRNQDTSRSSSDPMTAMVEVSRRLSGECAGRIPLEAFRAAAARELLALFGLDLGGDLDRLVHLSVPAELRAIHKPDLAGRRRRPILPRVFAYELRSEGERHEVNQVIESGVPVVALGYEDFPDYPDLNDFLVAASRDGWLEKQLMNLGVAPR